MLNKFKTIRFGGVAFKIRKLSPAMFLENENYPLNNIISDSEKMTAENVEKESDKIKEMMLEMINKGVVSVRSLLFKKLDKKEMIDRVMEVPDMYAYLYSEILKYSFNLKKKTKSIFNLTKTLR